MNYLNLAFLAPIIMAWNQIRNIATRLSSVLVTRGIVEGLVADHMHVLLWQEWSLIPMGERLHKSRWLPLKSLAGQTGPVVSASISGAMLFRKGLRVVSWQPLGFQKGRLVCVRGLANYEELVRIASSRLYTHFENRSALQVGNGFHIDRFQGKENSKAMLGSGAFGRNSLTANAPVQNPEAVAPSDSCDNLGEGVLPTHQFLPLIHRQKEDVGSDDELGPFARYYVSPDLQVVIQETETWLAATSWMHKRGIPCRRGILLEGPPGTGKSSFVRALAEHFKVRLVIVELATCSDFDLTALRDMGRTPSIFLFEDIDRIFRGDVNVVERDTDKVTFDAFLNLLSGVDPLQGLIFLTANHPENIDSTLTRPGRIDRRVKIPLLDARGAQMIAERIMQGCPQELIQSVLDQACEPLPAAHFENLCIQAAMGWYWEHHLSLGREGLPK